MMEENHKIPFDVPILLIIFNRPETTRRVFETIRLVKPQKLFIAADGHRPNKPGEKELCDQTKSIVKNIDWPCEVHTDYLAANIGPCKRVPSAVDWFFDNVERGIILEDDCLPNESFFTFCQELLEKYETEEKIMSISGSNFQDEKRGKASYYFSFFPSSWGWATWRRSWKLFDRDMKQFPDFIRERKIEEIIPVKHRAERRYWINFLKKEYAGKYIFWDLKWIFSHWCNNAYCIVPNDNLITNIGFGIDATHTKKDLGLSITTKSIDSIEHPEHIAINNEADRYLYEKIYKTTLLKKILHKLSTLM